jgi:LmbE family N-acetylglucosaminyl deacetylase
MRSVYLSPHLDDTALSCGGLVHSQATKGCRPLVITCFAGVPDYNYLTSFATTQHAGWRNEALPVEDRRQEDIAAMECLGAEHAHWQFLDCIYRRGEDGAAAYDSEEALFGVVHESDQVLLDRLTERLLGFLAQQNVVLCAPLAAGHHVDHQLVLSAAMRVREVGYSVRFYEDYPYSHDPQALRGALDSWSHLPQPSVETLTAYDVEAKIAAVQCYRSQLATLFGDTETLPMQILSHAQRVGGGQVLAERYWQGGELRA